MKTSGNPANMHLARPASTISSADDVYRRAAMFVSAFNADMALSPPLDVSLVVPRKPFTRSIGSVQGKHAPISSESDNHRVTIHLNTPDLVGIPTLALQGWLDAELAAVVIGRQHGLHRYNFKRDILPIFQVSGMAVQFVRYLVAHLEKCLKSALLTDMILEMQHGLPLAYYHYLKTAPAVGEKQDYLKSAPHKWMRAIVVCKKCQAFLPVALLDAAGYLPTLRSFWWQCHRYIFPEDRELMQKLAATFFSHRHDRFAAQMVAAFKTIASDLLV